MPAYVVGDIRATDPAKFGTYVPPALEAVARYGGRLLAAGGGGNMEALDGAPLPERMVLIEFPDADAVRRWYRSAEYQAVLPIRLASTQGCVFLIDGARQPQ